MSFYKRIVGQRIYLSPFDPKEPEIAETWAEWMNDKVTAETYGGGGYNLFTKESAKEQIESMKGYRFSIVLLDGDRLALTVHSDNEAGISCYTKIGFKEVGRLKEWVFKNGRYVDKLHMSLLDSEFMEFDKGEGKSWNE
ncbi:MAG: GNAT family N-acetyltransferase [Lachnospiraceae bacterium]|jgi:RimJ/RimL family protein N-acetyltransferase|nr:GNAT family N-acetyltransferase [Lachnospiraceae bacterium]